MRHFTPSLLLLLAAFPVAAQTTPPQPAHHASGATVSPDGRRIAFFSDRDGAGEYYVMNADGSDVRRVTTDGGHRGRAYWSRDGKNLVFSKAQQDTSRIFSVSVEGGQPVEIGRITGRGGSLPMGEGNRVIYGVGDWARMQLVSSRLDGSDQKPITSDPSAAYWCPTVTPRGDRVFATRNDSSGMQVWMIGLDGSGSRAVTRFDSTQGRPQCPAVTPDARHVAAQAEVKVPGDSTKTVGHIWLIDAATGSAVRLAPHRAPYHDELPTWFPNGKRLVFQSDRSGRWELWAINADGTGEVQLTQ